MEVVDEGAEPSGGSGAAVAASDGGTQGGEAQASKERIFAALEKSVGSKDPVLIAGLARSLPAAVLDEFVRKQEAHAVAARSGGHSDAGGEDRRRSASAEIENASRCGLGKKSDWRLGAVKEPLSVVVYANVWMNVLSGPSRMAPRRRSFGGGSEPMVATRNRS